MQAVKQVENPTSNENETRSTQDVIGWEQLSWDRKYGEEGKEIKKTSMLENN